MWKVSLVVKDFLITVAERKKYHTSLFFYTSVFTCLTFAAGGGSASGRMRCAPRGGERMPHDPILRSLRSLVRGYKDLASSEAPLSGITDM